jgi:hypothetical protein
VASFVENGDGSSGCLIAVKSLDLLSNFQLLKDDPAPWRWFIRPRSVTRIE